jgi:hypothetical protein
MGKTTTLQPETRAQLPVPIGSETFAVKGQRYEILRFKGKGPNLEQTIAIAKSMQGRRMLTPAEAKKISDDRGELNTTFRNILKPDESGYVSDPQTEQLSYGTWFGHISGILFIACGMPSAVSSVVILKVTSEATAPRDIAVKLRKE